MIVDVGKVEFINQSLNLTGFDGCSIQGCRIDLGVDILDKEDRGGMPVPLLIGEFLPFELGQECRIDNHVRPAALSPFLGIVEHIPLLVCPEITHVNVVDLCHLPGKIPDHLESESTIDFKILCNVLDLFPDGVTPPVHLLVSEFLLEGHDGHIIPCYIINIPVDDGSQGGDIVIQIQEIVRICIPCAPFHHVPPCKDFLNRGDNIGLQIGVDSSKGECTPPGIILFRTAHML